MDRRLITLIPTLVLVSDRYQWDRNINICLLFHQRIATSGQTAPLFLHWLLHLSPFLLCSSFMQQEGVSLDIISIIISKLLVLSGISVSLVR